MKWTHLRYTTHFSRRDVLYLFNVSKYAISSHNKIYFFKKSTVTIRIVFMIYLSSIIPALCKSNIKLLGM